jgi:hypothetical protein
MEEPLNPGGLAMPPGKVCGAVPLAAKRANPELPDSVNTGFVRSGEPYGVIWSAQYGGACPRCGIYTKHAYKHSPWRNSRKTRYHLCPACNFRFKSIHEDAVKLDFPPTPEDIRYLRKYR